MSSDRYRTQPQNFQDCINKIYEAIVEAAYIPPETSPETLKKIAKLYFHGYKFINDE